MTSSRRRFSQAALAVAVLAAAMLGFGAAPAAAHAALERTSPADGSSLALAPTSVSLIFDEAPIARFSTVHVTGPDGQRRDAGPITITDSTVTELLAGSLPAGRYVVDWRVISDDGHPVSGEFAFTAQDGAARIVARAVPSTAGAIGAPTTQQAKSSSSTGVIIAVVAAVVVLGGLIVFLIRRKPAGHDPAVQE